MTKENQETCQVLANKWGCATYLIERKNGTFEICTEQEIARLLKHRAQLIIRGEYQPQ